jgi:hypothetical protein
MIFALIQILYMRFWLFESTIWPCSTVGPCEHLAWSNAGRHEFEDNPAMLNIGKEPVFVGLCFYLPMFANVFVTVEQRPPTLRSTALRRIPLWVSRQWVACGVWLIGVVTLVSLLAAMPPGSPCEKERGSMWCWSCSMLCVWYLYQHKHFLVIFGGQADIAVCPTSDSREKNEVIIFKPVGAHSIVPCVGVSTRPSTTPAPQPGAARTGVPEAAVGRALLLLRWATLSRRSQ